MSTCDRAVGPVLLTGPPCSCGTRASRAGAGPGARNECWRMLWAESPEHHLPHCGLWNTRRRIWESLESSERRRVAPSWRGHPARVLAATPGPQAHPQHQHPHVCDGQVDLCPLAVAGGVRADPVHLQLPGHVQQLNVRLGRRLPSGETRTHKGRQQE